MSISLSKIAIACTFAVSSAFAQATVVATNTTYGVFDGSAGSRILSVGTHGMINDLNLSITFAKCDDPAIGPNGTACIGQGSSFNREIAFSLTGPDGTTVRLVDFFTYTGQTPGSRVTVNFDDQAAVSVGGSVVSGTFRPVGSLAAFNGIDMFGDYILGIIDASSEDPLEFISASLDVTSSDLQGTVPEPGSWMLLGLGLAGMAYGRKRTT